MIVVDDILTSHIQFQDTYVAIGNFDGVHYGHKKLILKAVEKAKKNNKKSVIFTFANHPKDMLNKSKKFNYINTNEEKLFLLEKLGVDYVILQNFNKSFSEKTPLEFVDLLKEKLSVKEIFVGFNFSFGKGGLGNTTDLKYLCKNRGIVVNEVAPIIIDNEIVSSSLIRKMILLSDFKKAIKYLGHPLIVIGEVVHGKKIARQLGFPTANIKISNRLYPPFGIYGAYLNIEERGNQKFYGVINVGINPTLKPGELSLEVHILDFNDDIYGKKLYIEIIAFMREEKKFNSIDELKKTIANDIDTWKKHKKEIEDGNIIKD